MHKDKTVKTGGLTYFELAQLGFGLYRAGLKTPDEIGPQ
jgi:hypothetical protein